MTKREELRAAVYSGAIESRCAQRFWAKVDRRGDGECWLWQGALNYGYGVFKIGRANFRSNRIAYILAHGQIPDGLIVRHKCDVPACCNPDHLELGTFYENQQDCIVRGRARQPRGEECAQSKLTAELVISIRKNVASGRTHVQTASDFGVSKGCVLSAMYRWKHLPMPEGIRRRAPKDERAVACALVKNGLSKAAAARMLGRSPKFVFLAISKQVALEEQKT
jgi:hypothetical protein